MNIPLDARRQVGIPWFSAGAGRILPTRNTKPIMIPVCSPFDVFRRDLWNLERTQTNVATELGNEIIAITGGIASDPIEEV